GSAAAHERTHHSQAAPAGTDTPGTTGSVASLPSASTEYVSADFPIAESVQLHLTYNTEDPLGVLVLQRNVALPIAVPPAGSRSSGRTGGAKTSVLDGAATRRRCQLGPAHTPIHGWAPSTEGTTRVKLPGAP